LYVLKVLQVAVQDQDAGRQLPPKEDIRFFMATAQKNIRILHGQTGNYEQLTL
jgi:hypothetical protein